MSALRSASSSDREIVLRHAALQPVRLGALAEELGLEVRLATLKPGISGEIKKSETAPSGYLIRINRHEKRERQRFTLAHEITHYLLHREKIGNGLSDDILYRSRLSDTLEAEANRGAAEILMPRGKLLERWQEFGNARDEETIAALAAEFQVSKQALSIRLGIK
ncbi:ImmA/IrrE family metallo-endopeptidase [Pelagibacterium xiamenense]|uniref:ImmA/IrrE family metallo-endopeptidase n=1 Tax=Pelagibacterium xiamenense TaxID=2901140 RepID=UPI001E655025|nr:ImmA/IrrE family metallo-endopeptidase [Pelagibacterium xiamenense]MCD7060278.1 ImmA/IrrE family metallo-endopeptidase [Pelagibacterium xiamenense]